MNATAKYLNPIIEYFDLQAETRKKQSQFSGIPTVMAASGADTSSAANDSANKKKFAPVIPQYVALVLGIISDPFIKNYIATKSFGLDLGQIGPLMIFSILMGIMILPAVYQNSFAPDKPILVQLAAIFTAGVGWQTLFEAAAKTVG